MTPGATASRRLPPPINKPNREDDETARTEHWRFGGSGALLPARQALMNHRQFPHSCHMGPALSIP